MGRLIDLQGHVFERLTVQERTGSAGNGDAVWRCICLCGMLKEVTGSHLRSGSTQSCGCLQKETVSERRTTHGMSSSKAYGVWTGMFQRTTNPKNSRFSGYGGRGIKVCDRWLTFSDFLADMGEPPEGLSIERINNDGDYEPSNCKWATVLEQNRNQRVKKNNKSGHSGVHWRKDSRKWRASIRADGGLINLGSFDQKSDAVNARKAGEAEYWS